MNGKEPEFFALPGGNGGTTLSFVDRLEASVEQTNHISVLGKLWRLRKVSSERGYRWGFHNYPLLGTDFYMSVFRKIFRTIYPPEKEGT